MTAAVSRTARWRPSAGRVLLVAAVLLLVVVALPWDAVGTNLPQRFAGPSAEHLLGTDQLGRDVLARLAVGARLSIGFTLVALVLSAVIGTVLGLLAGWAGRVVGLVVVAASDEPPGLGTVLVAVVIVGWTPFARLTFQLALRERGREYVEGAVALGAGTGRILFRHVLPNLLRPLGAHACLRFANVLLSIAGLSFLGLGAQPPTPEWGAMLAEARQYMFVAPQLVLLPALAVVGSALAVTVLGRVLERRWDDAAKG